MKVLDHGFVELVSHTGNPQMVTDTARCSTGSTAHDPDADRRLVRYLLGNGHTSPFRHYFFTFHVKAPLFVFRQWWKYQVGSTWREYEVEGLGVSGLGKVCAYDIQIDTDQGCSWNELSGRYKIMAVAQRRGAPTLVRYDSESGRVWRKGSKSSARRSRSRSPACNWSLRAPAS